MVQEYSEKATFPNKKKEKKNTCSYLGACISKDDRTKGRGFNEEGIKTKSSEGLGVF